MSEFLVGGSAWWAVPAGLLAFGVIFGFFPGFVLRLLVLLYPADDPRRRELVAELYVLGRMERIEWVFQQLETALFEGVTARLARRRAAKDSPDEETTDSGEERQDDDPDAVRRRAYLAAAALDWTVPPAPSRIGMTDVRQVEAATRALRDLDRERGRGSCRDAVVAQLSWAQQLLSASATDVVRKRLRVALADLHNLAGWTSFGAGMTASAHDHFRRALDLARADRAEGLVANILFRMGRTRLKEDPEEALTMFQLGRVAARRSGSELGDAVLCAHEAWAYALMGRAHQAMMRIGRARTAFARLEPALAREWAQDLENAERFILEELRRKTEPPSTAVGQRDAQ